MKIFKIIIVNLTIIITLIFIGEVVLNYFFYARGFDRHINLKESKPDTDKFVIPQDQYMEQVLKYNLNKNLQVKKYRFRTNNEGFIIGERTSIETPIKVDGIFYGGSTTECLFVNESKRFPFLVQKKLSEKLDLELNFLNSGVSGKNSMQSTFDLLAKGIRFKPKFVVLMHNINDLSHLMFTGSYWDAPESRSIIKKQVINKNYFQISFPNFYRIYTKINFLINPDKKNDEWKDYRKNHINISDEDIKNQFRKSINNFIRIAQNYNIDIILMTQFNRLNYSDSLIYKNTYVNDSFSNDLFYKEKFYKLYPEFNDITRDIALKENVDLIDLDLLVMPKKKFMYDQVHLNTEGSIFVAELLNEFLLNKYYK